MLQVANLPETLKIKEHIQLFQSYYPHPMDYQQVISYAGLQDIQNRYSKKLSGGEKQRVQLARVLAQIWEHCEGDASTDGILLLDEPSAAFDLAHQLMLIDIVRQISTRGVTVVMVMHDLNLAAKCADQMVFMNCGHCTAVGTVTELLTPELIHKVFSVDAEVITHPVQGTPMVVV